MMLNIVYAYGKGHASIDLDQVLPATSDNVKRIISICEMSVNAYEHINAVYDYIAGIVEKLQAAREKLDANKEYEKRKIEDITRQIKKYIANINMLAKAYGLQEMSDAEEVKMKKADVFAVVYDKRQGKNTIEKNDGWTFEKAGLTFDVYKKDKGYYIVLLHGTGLQCATASAKGKAPAEVTPRILAALEAGQAKIKEAEKAFVNYMVEAGFMDPEPEPAAAAASAEETEPATEEKARVTGYSVTPRGTVVIFYDNNVRERITTDMPEYKAALTAALQFAKDKAAADQAEENTAGSAAETTTAAETAEAAEETTEAAEAFKGLPVIDTSTGCMITDNAADLLPAAEPEKAAEKAADQAEETEPEKEPAEAAARNPKAARGPVPEKTFINTSINGRTWKILFDGQTEKTRVIFSRIPTAKEKALVKEAGFWYAPSMKSWNKKLTWKAYRAALQLAEKLAAC